MILFLDFDGVLHQLQRSEPDFVRLPLLWKILRACPHVDVVFSTSWREVFRPEEMIEFVTWGGGENLTHRFIGSNPTTPRAQSTDVPGHNPERHNECVRWLEENGQQHRSWLAIDDIPEIFPPNSPTLYLVDAKKGLTEADVLAIIERIQLNLIETALMHDDGLAAQQHLAAGRPIYYGDEKYPGGIVRKYPDGRLQLVSINNLNQITVIKDL